VKSVYQHLTKDDNGHAYREIWRAKILLKIKIFMWLMAKKSFLLRITCWLGTEKESPCHLHHRAMCFGQKVRPSSCEEFWPWIHKVLVGGEKVYMLGLSAICWALWTVRNKTCFEKIRIKGPNEIIVSTCFFMKFWAGLYPEDAQEIIKKGV
jgi:hypothetical protein